MVITTAAPSCSRIYYSYSAYVQYSGNTGGAGANGNGTNRIELTVWLAASQNEQWVYLRATSDSRAHRLDTAPNSGSLALALNDTSQGPRLIDGARAWPFRSDRPAATLIERVDVGDATFDLH